MILQLIGPLFVFCGGVALLICAWGLAIFEPGAALFYAVAGALSVWFACHYAPISITFSP